MKDVTRLDQLEDGSLVLVRRDGDYDEGYIIENLGLEGNFATFLICSHSDFDEYFLGIEIDPETEELVETDAIYLI